jgi:hypothetical protein
MKNKLRERINILSRNIGEKWSRKNRALCRLIGKILLSFSTVLKKYSCSTDPSTIFYTWKNTTIFLYDIFRKICILQWPKSILPHSSKLSSGKYTCSTVCCLYYCIVLQYLWKNIINPRSTPISDEKNTIAFFYGNVRKNITVRCHFYLGKILLSSSTVPEI